jgi:hypothetical protein
MLDVSASDPARLAPLHILVRGDADALSCSVACSLADRIAARTGGDVSAVVDVLPVGRADALLGQVRANPALFSSADVVVCSLAPELTDGRPGAETRARFQHAMGELISVLSQAGVYVVVLNGSTVVPDDVASRYCNGEETPALVMHRLNAALMELATGEGISILDADRIIAELGGEHHVTGLLEYSDTANDALCAELVTILGDAGYLDGRARRDGSGARAARSALRIEMVADRVAVRGGRVRGWRLAEGDTFASGDAVVDVDVTQWANLARNRNRPHLGGASDREDELKIVAHRRPYAIRVVALEGGVLGKIAAPVGTEVAVGDLLGVVGVTPDIDAPLEAPAPGGPTLQTYACRVRRREERVMHDKPRPVAPPPPAWYSRWKRFVPKGVRRRARRWRRRVRRARSSRGGARG